MSGRAGEGGPSNRDLLRALICATDASLDPEHDCEDLFETGLIRLERDFTDEYLTVLTDRGRAAIRAAAQRAGEGEGRGLVVQWAVPSEVQVGEKVLDTSLNEFRRVTGIRPYKLGHEIAYEGDEQEWRLVDQRTLLVVVSNLETCGPPSTCSEPPTTGIAARVSGLRPGAAEPSPEEVERAARALMIYDKGFPAAWDHHSTGRERNSYLSKARTALDAARAATPDEGTDNA